MDLPKTKRQQRMVVCERLVVVSGASRGVGVGICRQALSSDLDAHVVVTARQVDQANTIRDKLNAELGPPNRAHSFPLDVTDAHSCQAFADAISGDVFGIGADAELPLSLVNNAGVAYDLPWFPTPWAPEAASKTLDVNLFGAERLTSALLPQLLKSKDGRVIFVSSGGGRANMMRMAEARRAKLLNEDLTWEEIKSLAETFVEEYESAAKVAMADEKEQQLPFLSPSGLWLQSYGFSKACMGSYCQILQRKHPNLLSLTCSPGFIKTDMSKTYAKYDDLKTIDEGGAVVARLAVGDREKESLQSGVFYSPDGEIVSWVADS